MVPPLMHGPMAISASIADVTRCLTSRTGDQRALAITALFDGQCRCVVVELIMASQMKKTIRHCSECLVYRDSGPDGAHCAMNNKTFGTHPVSKAAPGWCMLRGMALVLEYKGS